MLISLYNSTVGVGSVVQSNDNVIMSDSEGLVQSWSGSRNSLKFIFYNDVYPQ